MEFTKRMGHTVYLVRVHGSEDGTGSSFEDALVRLIVNDLVRLIVNDPLAFSDRPDILKLPPVSRRQPERINT